MANSAPCDQSIPVGDETAVHVGPGVGDIARAKARDPGAEHQLDEQVPERQSAPAGQPRPGVCARAARRSSAVQISAANRNKANSRCADSRYGLTSVRPSRPDMTMNQPTAPCSPPRTNNAASRQPYPWGIARANGKPADADEEDQAEDPAEQAVDPFPEEDELEAG